MAKSEHYQSSEKMGGYLLLFCLQLENLRCKIEGLRQRMNEIALIKGISNPDIFFLSVLKISF